VAATPTASASAEPTPDLATLDAFVSDLAAAIRRGRDAELMAALHPAVIERYGDATCQAHIAANVSGGSVRWEILEVTGPAPWPYASDGMETLMTETWTVRVRQPGADPEERDLHFAHVEGTWRWFTDCGEPA
jgi:hypothetical protein